MARFDLPAFARFVARYRYPLVAGALIVCGVAVRLALILAGWPHTNSEEGTMGLEAMHILLRGERPIYFYGQHYMGAGEAYLGALAFRLFGVSLVALRVSMVALYALFMLGVFWLAHLLYSRRVALVSLAVLILGTPFLLQIELLADGGKAETLALGALLFALASWLALTRPTGQTTRGQRLPRAAAFVAWGLCAGLGLYTYAIIAPFALISGLLLVVACWRELRGWRWTLPLAGLLLGLLPVFIYTVSAPFAENPIAVFLSLRNSLNGGEASGLYLLARQVTGTLLYTLPAVTGLLTYYPVEALPFYGPPNASTVATILLGGGWSLGYLALLGVATVRPFRTLRQRWTQRRTANAPTVEDKTPISLVATQEGTRNLARLLLALTGWLTIAAYLFSATAANNPHSGRYMIGLLVIVPAVLWPLVQRTPGSDGAGSVIRRLWRPLAAALLVASVLLGIVGMARAIPEGVAASQRDVTFARELRDHGVTRFYSDYWTCDLMNFVSREQLTCAVIGEYGQPGLTRYPPYAAAVWADPTAPYVLRRGTPIERTFVTWASERGQRYQMAYRIGSYAVYTPLST